MKYINRVSFFSMVSYDQITARTEMLAKGSAVAALFMLPISTSITLILFFLATLLTLLSGHWHEKYEHIKNNPIALCFLGFYALYLIGITYSFGSAAQIKHQLLKFSWLLFTPVLMTLFSDKKWQRRGINAFLFSMSITLILSFTKNFQWVQNPHFWQTLNHRLSTTTSTVFKDYIIQSFLMSLAAMLFLYRFIKRKNGSYAVLFLLASIDVMFISQSRTGYIIFILLLAYTLFSQLNLKKALLLCGSTAALLIVLVVLLPGAAHQRVQYALQDIQQWDKGQKQTSLGYRMAWQINALRLIEKRPLIGYGTGSIRAAYATLPQHDTAQTGIVDNASNEYLNIAIQFGTIGLLLFLGMLLLQWRYSFRLPKESSLLIQTLLIALCIGNLANSWLMDVTQAHYYALMMALAFGAFLKHPKPSTAINHANNDDVATDTPA